MTNAVYVIGTLDTKRDELTFIRDLVAATGIPTCLVDVGTQSDGAGADVAPGDVAAAHPDGADAVLGAATRGDAVAAMGEALARFLPGRGDLGGAIGAGGSGNTALVCAGLRALPFGVPKVMVSTVASGDTAPYVGPSDLTMVNAVADIAGLNRITRPVLGNAAHAVAGMVRDPVPSAENKPAISLTMFGVTTTAVTQIRDKLEDRYDCLVFHATGAGGRAMEMLMGSGLVEGCIDLTTTEIADLVVGGIMAAGPERLDVVAQTRLPYVGSCGALDMVNFGARESVPDKFSDRNLFVHNPQVTLMRTTPEENREIGRWIGRKLNACEGPVRFLLPEGGVSQIDAPGQPFHDPEADAALFAAIEETVIPSATRRVARVPHNINDAEFAQAAVAAWREIAAGPEA